MRAEGHALIREEIFPTIFCEGCGGGIVLNAFVEAILNTGIRQEEIVMVTGIGCSSWIPSPYFKADTLHTTHGRAIAFASGVKVMKPDMKVIVIAGDGDIAGIGGNHLIHAARRNIDITVFMVNNYIYGMTGGQVSPTTPYGTKTTTTPYYNVEYPLQAAELVAAAGATFSARWTTFNIIQLIKGMQRALMKKGFSFIEIISQCPVGFGKNVGMRSAVDFLRFFKENTVRLKKAAQMPPEKLEDKIVIGTFVDRDRKEFTENLKELNDKRRKELGL